MRSAYTKDILRTIKKNFKRFLALMAIMALGLTAFIGIVAACQDVYIAADRFYDAQNLFDIQIMSTLGLTKDDIKALEKVDDVSKAEGAFSESVLVEVKELDKKVSIRNVSNDNMNEPYLLKGALPDKDDEIAVTRDFLEESGKKIGDTVKVTIEEEDSILKKDTFKITGTVIDPLNVNNPDGAAVVRDTNTSDFNFFATTEAFDSDVYTAVYLSIKGASELDCYSDEYEDKVAAVSKDIEDNLQTKRQQARYDELYGDAKEEIDDAQKEADDEFAKADKEIADAKQKLEDGRKEFEDGKKKLDDSLSQWNENHDKIIQSEKDLTTKENEAYAGFAEAEATLNNKQTELYNSLSDVTNQVNSFKTMFGDKWPEDSFNKLVATAEESAKNMILANPDTPPDFTEGGSGSAQVSADSAGVQQEVIAQIMTSEADVLQSPKAQQIIQGVIAAGIGQGIVEGGMDALDINRQAYEVQKQDAINQINAGWAEINSGKEQLNAGKTEIERGYETLNTSQKELEDGEKELAENEMTLADKKKEAKEEIEDARKKLEDIKKARWYVQDRTAISSYSGMDSDLQSIEVIGRAFPILFLVIAILISLTTMTRMVEEERGLIGIYKALGYSGVSIGWKYVSYALLACIFGGITGNALGSIGLPALLRPILGALYDIPDVRIEPNVLYGVLGTLLFLFSIVTATTLVTYGELRKSPASLMRPKSPKPGSRIFLERIKFIWKRLKFLNKVTARNLFRYKKRLIMTLVGIAGCTALVLVGFAIRDSVKLMIPNQYEKVYRYDVMAVGNGDEDAKFIKDTKANAYVKDSITARVETIKVYNADGGTESLPMIVIPNGVDLSDYIYTKEVKGKLVEPDTNGVLLTRNIAKILSVSKGDEIKIQDLDLEQEEVLVNHIVDNYLGNSLYISQKLYEEKFGEYEDNAVYLHLKSDAVSQDEFVETLEKNENVATATSVEEQKTSFSSNFSLINYVIYLLIILAAGLAFVVLFTLANTNISERSRELATIKVLGFYDIEVHSYVNKETLLLTVMGILLGLPLGYVMSYLLLAALNMPSLEFVLQIKPLSYLYSAAISFSFTVIVNLITNSVLDKINMVEALKSVE